MSEWELGVVGSEWEGGSERQRERERAREDRKREHTTVQPLSVGNAFWLRRLPYCPLGTTSVWTGGRAFLAERKSATNPASASTSLISDFHGEAKRVRPVKTTLTQAQTLTEPGHGKAWHAPRA